MKRYWMVKQEPTAYAWEQFVADGRTNWTGVRNFQARNNLRAMQLGDEVFYYHSVEGKEVVGIATVSVSAFPDPTATEGDWSCVELEPKVALQRRVTLEEVKADAVLQSIPLVKQSRLSVIPLSKVEFDRIVQLSKQ
jgi:predicted RNA-binding protein with PUA-like domain